MYMYRYMQLFIVTGKKNQNTESTGGSIVSEGKWSWNMALWCYIDKNRAAIVNNRYLDIV